MRSLDSLRPAWRSFRRVGPLVIGLVFGSLRAVAQCPADQALGLEAVHRAGQTFLTWDETAPAPAARYHLYRSPNPITTPADLAAAERIWTVGEDSGEFYADRISGRCPCTATSSPLFEPRFLERLPVPCGPSGCPTACDPASAVAPVPDGRGVFVYTIHDDDPTDLGFAFYAVTKVPASGPCAGVEITDVLTGPGGNTAVVFERNAQGQLDEPRPLEIPRDCLYVPFGMTQAPGDGKRHVFVQYMDVREWNPTFDAPNAVNCWWGEDPAEAKFLDTYQYAYTYVVVEPEAACTPLPPEGLPVVVDLHPHAEGKIAQASRNTSAAGCAIRVNPIDTYDTWWFGFADYDRASGRFDYRTAHAPLPGVGQPDCPGPPPGQACPPQGTWDCDAFRLTPPDPNAIQAPDAASGDRVVNYTELRILRAVSDLLQMAQPSTGNPGGDGSFVLPVDPERIYVVGTSMGGAGALALATRYPDVFAAAVADKPMVDYADYQGEFEGELRLLWGDRNAPELPVVLRAPPELPVGLSSYAARGPLPVWKWQDHRHQHLHFPSRVADDNAPFGTRAGLCDTTLPYATQALGSYAGLRRAKRAFAGAVGCGGHGPTIHLNLPKSLGGWVESYGSFPLFDGWSVVKSESVPALNAGSVPLYPAPASCPAEPCTTVFDGHRVEWASSWNAWDTPPIESTTHWELSLRLTEPVQQKPTWKLDVAYVDVTPRRLQAFDTGLGGAYDWVNQSLATGQIVQQGCVQLGSDGVLTIPDVRVTSKGQRLIVVHAGGRCP